MWMRVSVGGRRKAGVGVLISVAVVLLSVCPRTAVATCVFRQHQWDNGFNAKHFEFLARSFMFLSLFPGSPENWNSKLIETILHLKCKLSFCSIKLSDSSTKKRKINHICPLKPEPAAVAPWTAFWSIQHFNCSRQSPTIHQIEQEANCDTVTMIV